MSALELLPFFEIPFSTPSTPRPPLPQSFDVQENPANMLIATSKVIITSVSLVLKSSLEEQPVGEQDSGRGGFAGSGMEEGRVIERAPPWVRGEGARACLRFCPELDLQ